MAALSTTCSPSAQQVRLSMCLRFARFGLESVLGHGDGLPERSSLRRVLHLQFNYLENCSDPTTRLRGRDVLQCFRRETVLPRKQARPPSPPEAAASPVNGQPDRPVKE